MKYIIIIIIIVVSLSWIGSFLKKKQNANNRRRAKIAALEEKAAAKAERERIKAEKARADEAVKAERERTKAKKAKFERQQAEADAEFLINQIDSLNKMLWSADEALAKAQTRVDHDEESNSHGSVVVSLKVVQKNINERDKLQKRVLMLENSIHAANKKLIKAQHIAKNT